MGIPMLNLGVMPMHHSVKESRQPVFDVMTSARKLFANWLGQVSYQTTDLKALLLNSGRAKRSRCMPL